MRIWTSLAALALAAPALAQQGTIETQPLEPLFVPGITQNNDGQSGNIIVQPVEPLTGPARRPVDPQSEQDPFREGFNDRAVIGEGEGSFIDRAFGTPPDEDTGEATLFEDQPEQTGEAGEPSFRDGGFSNGWMTPSDPALEPGQPQDGSEVVIDDEPPRFKEAPFASRGLFGPNQPKAIPRVARVEAEGAELRQLDKMTGTTRTVTLAAGEEREIGRLRVRLEGCRAPAEGGTHGTVAFLRVWDPHRDEQDPVFSGWMFAESPALSALDHPRYDVWVLGCTGTKAAGVKEASSTEG